MKTALFNAIRFGKKEVVKYLIDAGADVNLAVGFRTTPLKEAVSRGHTEIVEYLINAGADYECLRVYSMIETLLMIAIPNGYIENN